MLERFKYWQGCFIFMKLTLGDIETLVRNHEDDVHEVRKAIENFGFIVQAGVLAGKVCLGSLYEPFKKMRSSLHRTCNDPNRLDLSAIVYALQRLPKEITLGKEIYIQKEQENLTDVPGIKRIKAGGRKRAAYDLGDELEFVARDEVTDVTDIVQGLVMYGIEASEKIRVKLKDSPLVDELDGLENNPERKNQVFARLANVFGVKYDQLKKADAHLKFGFIDIIKNALRYDPSKVLIRFDSEFSRTDASIKARKWNQRILEELKEYDGRPLAIFSSDNSSVVNLLTGFAEENREEIITLSRKNGKDDEEDFGLSKLNFDNPSMLYYALQVLTKDLQNKSLLARKIAREEELGIKFIRDEFDTGVDVQIFDLSRIVRDHPDKLDPRIVFDRDYVLRKGLVLLNMHYSFGRQGVHNMGGLCRNLGERIESISITGRAGIVCVHEGGERFDIMLPNYVVPQIAGGIYDFPNGNQLKKKDLSVIFDGKIHDSGSVLTVPGTALQSDLVYYDYIMKDNILGVEMEAAPYLDAIEKAYHRGLLRKDVRMHVGYWASDCPLNPDETLAESHRERGSIPSYALIISIMNKILNNGK